MDMRMFVPVGKCPAEKCEDCPLNHYGMTCTSHREEYAREHKGEQK